MPQYQYGPGNGVYREARDGACVMYREMGADEEHSVDGGRHGSQGSRARDDTKRAKTAVKCTPNSNNCKTCGATIGTDTYCSACNGENYAPVDGVCVDVSASNQFCIGHASGVCNQCGDASFMYQGGCYETAASPGKAMCTKAVAGVCTTAAAGYFIPTGAVNTAQSIVKCDDVNKVTVSGNTYKGVAGCQECVDPDAAPGARAEKVAVCTRCQEQKYLKDNACVDGADDCGTGYAAKKDSKNGNRCVSCTDKTDGVTDCETCEYNTAASKIKCTKCDADKYLKTTADGATTCVTDCSDGYFQHTATSGDLKTCQPCATANGLTPPVTGIEGCTSCTYTSNTLKCTACGEGKKPNKEGTGCFDCSISGCTYCSGTGKCEECASGFTLSEDKTKCTSSSANRSGLSTGAIAGISVAAVVVVGGLVGFLCWWFICRGKA